MEIKLIESDEIIYKLLRKDFLKDFEQGKCCSSDNIIYYRKNNESLEKLFKKWLVENEYATEIYL